MSHIRDGFRFVLAIVGCAVEPNRVVRTPADLWVLDLCRIQARAIDLRLTFEFVGWHRRAEQIALREIDAERLQPFVFLAGLDAFGGDRHVQPPRRVTIEEMMAELRVLMREVAVMNDLSILILSNGNVVDS